MYLCSWPALDVLYLYVTRRQQQKITNMKCLFTNGRPNTLHKSQDDYTASLSYQLIVLHRLYCYSCSLY
ncbi:hypothetical protein LZ31DRAFT_265215 [Colletotrichum somersetense]|nr:hypothetical protein LZ31DRAFT_265215 [Colletotrichum somersetense]